MSEAQTVKEAILSTKLDNLAQQVSKIDIKLDTQNKHFDIKFSEISAQYVTQSQYSELKEDLNTFKKSVRVNYVVVAIITALVTALIYAQITGRARL